MAIAGVSTGVSLALFTVTRTGFEVLGWRFEIVNEKLAGSVPLKLCGVV